MSYLTQLFIYSGVNLLYVHFCIMSTANSKMARHNSDVETTVYRTLQVQSSSEQSTANL
jgi:hypothetical protein